MTEKPKSIITIPLVILPKVNYNFIVYYKPTVKKVPTRLVLDYKKVSELNN